MKIRLKNSNNTAKILRIDPAEPDPHSIRMAVDILERKGVLVFPTTGLYGLGADALSAEAVRRVFTIKQRPAHMPVLVMLPCIDDMSKVVRMVPDHARPLLKLWPGGITFIFEAGDQVPVNLTAGTGKIGVRIPKNPVARALAETFGGPVTGTSANLSGGKAASRVTDLDRRIGSRTDLILDAGVLAGGSGSTILDVTCWPVKLIREGAVKRKAIDHILNDG